MTADEDRILVFAPLGRDCALLCEVLSGSGLRPHACVDEGELGSRVAGAGAALLTQEALSESGTEVLIDRLGAQPPWSDLPLILLADGESTPPAIDTLRAAGNLTVIERPVRRLALVTAVHAALRARRRQYEIRDLVEQEQTARRDLEAASVVKDQFLATVSHELKNPLGAILLWARLLAEESHDEKLLAGLQAIEKSAEAQSKLVEDLLDVSRMSSGKLSLSLEPIDLRSVVEAAVEVVRPAAERDGIHLRTDLSTVDALWLDPVRVEQILWNILSNAVKFTPAGGKVTVRLWSDDRQVHLSVSDTGRGIDPEFLPFVFDRFRQADACSNRQQGGLGLGLAISRQLTELHGGSIRAESPGLGGGAVFTVVFPLAERPYEPTERQSRLQLQDPGSPS